MSRLSTNWTEGRPYNETHPWLAFAFHAEKLPPDVLVQIGEIQARCVYLATVLLPPEVSQRLHDISLAKGIHGTTAIEGNTLSEEEVRAVIKKEKELPISLEYQKQEIENVLKACNEIKDNLVAGHWAQEITLDRIKQFNSWVLADLPLKDELIVPGSIRGYRVGVYDYTPPPPEYCVELLEKLCDWLDGLEPIGGGNKIADAVIRAAIAHLYIAWIHPFGDGNGRTARLLELNILISAGVPSVAAHLLSNHYNLTRPQYLSELQKTSQSGGDIEPFIKYAVQGFLDGLKEQQKFVENHLEEITWKDYVHAVFHKETGSAARRRRTLALTLGLTRKWMLKKELPQLTPELASLYATKTTKALSRDLNYLQERGLVELQRGQAIAALWKLEAFRPDRRSP